MLAGLIGGTYLINSHIVPWLLEARSIVITIPHNDPHLMKNHCTNQLIGALDLHHNGMNVGRRLKERKGAFSLHVTHQMHEKIMNLITFL